MDELYTDADHKGRVVIIRIIKLKGGKAKEAKDKDSVDILSTGKTSTAAIEVKDRRDGNYSSTKIEKIGGQIIEKLKYDRMNDKFKQYYDKLMFAAVYTDYIYIWDVTDSDFNWEWKWLPNSTVEDKGWSLKEVAYLHIYDAVAKYNTHKYEI